MKYRIEIYKIETQEVIENTYIPFEELAKRGEDDGSNYRNVAITKDVEEKIYEQVIAGDLDIQAVITAVNGLEEDE